MSGGLDSTLAVRLMHDLGTEIIGAHFTGPFCMCNRGKQGCVTFAREQAAALGIPFKTFALGLQYVDIVVNPKHGYGSGVNPCLDCRIMMLRRARELMEEEGASFVITGEVLGQRPMSQLRRKLDIIEHDSGLKGLILRPLSAAHMPETVPEKAGVIDRGRLLAIKGRGRREQMDLARMLEVGDYPCPAGGCLLTDKNFARRVRDAIAHEGLSLEDIALLKIGRHFRLPSGAKLVVGRNADENARVERMARSTDGLLVPESVMGPSSLVRAPKLREYDIALAAEIAAAYCDGTECVTMLCRGQGKATSVRSERYPRSRYDNVRV